MAVKYFHHALKFRKEVCIGCSHCMNVCPTHAIRIHGGKADLTDNRCVDCGKCYQACPVGAIIVEQDDFSQIFSYSQRVALIPSVLLGQFPAEVKLTKIYEVLHKLGFTHVVHVEYGVRILKNAIKEYLESKKETKPLISTFCPAIVRLIQVQFPALTENLILLNAPLDVTANYIKKSLVDEGANPKDVGIFYITPCAAKIAAVKSPVGREQSDITGVINMDFIFNKVFTNVKRVGLEENLEIHLSTTRLKSDEIVWSLTEGESSQMPGRALAIDEIGNVIEFLENLENKEKPEIDFLELRACDQSCAGGILTSGNRFYTVERLRKIAAQLKEEETHEPKGNFAIENHQEYLLQNITLKKVLPRSMSKLDDDTKQAMLKMQMVREIMKSLPYVDCGLCGSPTCKSLAEDIVQGRAEVTNCIFVQKKYEKNQWITYADSMEIMKEIWGKDKFED